MTNHELARNYELKHKVIGSKQIFELIYTDNDGVEIVNVNDKQSTGKLIIPSFITGIHRTKGYEYRSMCLDGCRFTEIYIDNAPNIMFNARMMCKGMNSDKLRVSFKHPECVNDTSGMFALCHRLKTIDLSGFNSINVTDMADMFGRCTMLTDLNISDLNTSNVRDMTYMFHACNHLESIDLSNFDTSKVEDFSLMFCFCANLKHINLSSFNTNNARYLAGMFDHCVSIKNLDLLSFSIAQNADLSGIFTACDNLNHILNKDQRLFSEIVRHKMRLAQ